MLTRTVGGTVAAHTVHVEVILLAVFPVGTNGRISGSLSVLWKLARLPLCSRCQLLVLLESLFVLLVFVLPSL